MADGVGRGLRELTWSDPRAEGAGQAGCVAELREQAVVHGDFASGTFAVNNKH